MKTALHLVIAGSLFLLGSCSGGYKLANTAPNDDVYASGKTKQTPTESYTPQEQTNPNVTDNSDRAGQYSDKRVDEEGDTYVTNNYYGDSYDEDYYYSRRIRRWYDPYYGFGYYSNVYANPYYWWGPTYYSPGLNVTLSFGNYYPWYWRPVYSYHSYYPWYTPYHTHYHYPYGYSYWNGYNNGYYNGYNNGYYDGYYGNNYGGYGNDYYGGGYGGGLYGSNTYYGHNTGGLSGNTNTTYDGSGNGGRVETVKEDAVDNVPSGSSGRQSADGLTGQKPSVAGPDRATSKDVQQKETETQSGKPNVQQNQHRTDAPTNAERTNQFDKKPQPHKGSTSIDVNPNTQVKPQPGSRTETKPSAPPRYQWETPVQNEQPRSTQPPQQSQPRYEQPRQEHPRDNTYEPRGNEYDAPRDRSPQEAYDHPRHQQPDVYVPREQPAYQAPRHNESPRFEAPRSVETPRQQQRNSYEAPRQQERTASPRDNDGPSFKSAPSEPSSNKRSSEGKNERRPR